MRRLSGRGTVGDRCHARGVLAAGALLLGGLVVAACGSGSSGTPATTASGAGSTAPTTASGGGSDSGLDALVDGVSKGSGSSFSATYLTVQASTGKSQTVTFAQSPPKSAIITPSGSFYVDGTTITECQGSGSTATCTTLPSSMSSAVSGLTGLYSPSVIVNELKGLQSQVTEHVAGFDVSTSTATYGGQASTCVTAKGASQPTPVTYCASTSSGILTHVSAAGNTVTLQAYSTDPPASTFAPPAGATVATLPAGV